MFKLLKGKLGPEAPERLVERTALESNDLRVGSLEVEVVEFGAGEAKHHACLVLADRHAIVASDLIYNGAHLYLQEHNLDGWLARLDDLEQLAAESGLRTILPGDGPAGGLSLIQGAREYLHAFASAIETENVESAREAILSRFPDHHVQQFLDVFSLPPTSPPPPTADRDEARPRTTRCFFAFTWATAANAGQAVSARAAWDLMTQFINVFPIVPAPTVYFALAAVLAASQVRPASAFHFSRRRSRHRILPRGTRPSSRSGGFRGLRWTIRTARFLDRRCCDHRPRHGRCRCEAGGLR